MRLALVLALLLVPTAAAWHGVGTTEPDTAFDADDGYMFVDGPPAAESRVYFDAFASVQQTSANPNVGALGTHVAPVGPTQFRALLGVWADCNGDGYIGAAEGALQDYASDLVTDRAACPAGGAHDDGTWVSELLMVGMVDPCERQGAQYRADHCGATPAFFADTRVLYVDHARVWADAAKPGDTSLSCPLAPLPRGATSGAGAALRAVDCFDDYAVSNRLGDLAPQGPFPVTLFGAPGAPGLLQRGSGSPAFTVWDCSDPKANAVRDPSGHRLNDIAVQDPSGGTLSGPQVIPIVGTQTVFRDEDGNAATPGVLRPAPDDADGNVAWVPDPNVAFADPTSPSSWWDAAELAADGPRGDCDASTDNAVGQHYLGGAVEGASADGVPGAKARNDLVFSFYDGYRGLDSHIDPTLHSEDFPTDGGLMATRSQYGGPLWSSKDTPLERPPLVRADDLSREDASWLTFYASFDATGLDVPHPTPGVYGQDACANVIGKNAPLQHGWTCDPASWWKDASGQDAMPRYTDGYAMGALPGDPFLLRDVDCYDDAMGLC